MIKYIFIWIPKTAGTSMYNALIEYNCIKLKHPKEFKNFDHETPVTFNHVSLEDLLEKKYLNQDYFNDAFKFAIVRNPYDRLVSLFSYYKKHNVIIPSDMSFKDFIIRITTEPIEPIGLYNRKGLSQANKQVDWLFTKDRNKLLVDYIAKLENISNQIKPIERVLDIKIELPYLNISDHLQYSEYYDKEIQDLVYDFYQEDFNFLGYSYEIKSEEVK